MRIIDADAYKSYIRKTYCQHCGDCFDEWRHDDCWQWYAIRTLEEMPTIEAKPVVYCKDCALRKTEDCAMYYQSDYNDEQYSWENDNDFCSWGRKTVKIPVISMEDVPKIVEETK